jgi:hypothetical protein
MYEEYILLRGKDYVRHLKGLTYLNAYIVKLTSSKASKNTGMACRCSLQAFLCLGQQRWTDVWRQCRLTFGQGPQQAKLAGQYHISLGRGLVRRELRAAQQCASRPGYGQKRERAVLRNSLRPFQNERSMTTCLKDFIICERPLASLTSMSSSCAREISPV